MDVRLATKMNPPKNMGEDAFAAKSVGGELSTNQKAVMGNYTAGKDKYESTLSESTMLKAIDKANKALEPVYRRFEYSVHDKTGEVIVKVIDQQNDEVINEIPNEKFLDLMAKLQELIGLNIDEKR